MGASKSTPPCYTSESRRPGASRSHHGHVHPAIRQSHARSGRQAVNTRAHWTVHWAPCGRDVGRITRWVRRIWDPQWAGSPDARRIIPCIRLAPDSHSADLDGYPSVALGWPRAWLRSGFVCAIRRPPGWDYWVRIGRWAQWRLTPPDQRMRRRV
ncbi:hypothetical protein PCANC_02757 [Puccinia coronata f. sp. avenae]|uniref:Uncharacterized protein n=1 Tax=Puccinia coronata f. sp. avenae TaxID=200324 RepID=A0A2N5VY85_9BASI|nr:hypothetical protein PCANC_02757 [Puccinia coronata f. sp. avenae]